MSSATTQVGVASPCTSVCTIEPETGLCAGCHRTLDEIASWSTMSDEAKLAVWRLLRSRREGQPGGDRGR